MSGTSGSLISASLAIALAGCAGAAPPQSRPADERVMVGYGAQDRGTVTGAINVLTEEQIGHLHHGRLVDVLRGRVPGLRVVRTPNGGESLRIRGQNSIMGSSEPLLVIDGLPILWNLSGALDSVNPADVERIDVLKDAGAAGIFGSRGANGVIIITTKRAL